MSIHSFPTQSFAVLSIQKPLAYVTWYTQLGIPFDEIEFRALTGRDTIVVRKPSNWWQVFHDCVVPSLQHDIFPAFSAWKLPAYASGAT